MKKLKYVIITNIYVMKGNDKVLVKHIRFDADDAILLEHLYDMKLPDDFKYPSENSITDIEASDTNSDGTVILTETNIIRWKLN